MEVTTSFHAAMTFIKVVTMFLDTRYLLPDPLPVKYRHLLYNYTFPELPMKLYTSLKYKGEKRCRRVYKTSS